MKTEQLNKTQTALLLLFIGAILVFVGWLLVLLPASFLFEAALYCLIGYTVGRHVNHYDWRWGVVLALPAMLVIIYFFVAATGAATSEAGIGNAVSFLLMPLGAALGIWLKVKKAGRQSISG